MGVEAVKFAADAGLNLDPWQQTVLQGTLGLVPGGKWAARNVGLLVPRQNGKGAVLEARELFGLFVLKERLIVHSAHKFDTSQEHFIRMQTLIEGNPDLAKHIRAITTANGKEGITLRNGSRLKFKARTVSGSGRGFSSDLLVLDEAMLLPTQALDAMLPTLITRPNPQVWYTSSAGTPDSEVLWRLVKRGRAQAGRLAYFEWGCETGVDVADPLNWANANPGLGYRLPLEELEDEFENLSADGFAREHLGIWDDAAEELIIPAAAWQDCEQQASVVLGTPHFALDVSPARSDAAIAAAGGNTDGATHVEITSRGEDAVDHRPGTEWVIPRLIQLQQTFPDFRVSVAAGQAAEALIPAMNAAGIPVDVVGSRDVAAACGLFYDLATTGRLAHLGQHQLTTALYAAKKRIEDGETAWVYGRKRSSGTITPLYAATLAVRAAVAAEDMTLHPINNVW